jgi:hypothetical protein
MNAFMRAMGTFTSEISDCCSLRKNLFGFTAASADFLTIVAVWRKKLICPPDGLISDVLPTRNFDSAHPVRSVPNFLLVHFVHALFPYPLVSARTVCECPSHQRLLAPIEQTLLKFLGPFAKKMQLSPLRIFFRV